MRPKLNPTLTTWWFIKVVYLGNTKRVNQHAKVHAQKLHNIPFRVISFQWCTLLFECRLGKWIRMVEFIAIFTSQLFYISLCSASSNDKKPTLKETIFPIHQIIFLYCWFLTIGAKHFDKVATLLLYIHYLWNRLLFKHWKIISKNILKYSLSIKIIYMRVAY